jgi:hypothetical protein
LPQVPAAFHELRLGSIAASFQQRFQFIYRQPKPPLKLFIYIVRAEHFLLLITIILSTNLNWTIQQRPLSDDQGFADYWFNLLLDNRPELRPVGPRIRCRLVASHSARQHVEKYDNACKIVAAA